MKTVTLDCHNEDFCPGGGRHQYPAIDEQVEVWAATEVPEVGSENMHEILPGQKVRVIDLLADAHEAMVQHGPVRVWLDIDDIDGIDNSYPQEG